MRFNVSFRRVQVDAAWSNERDRGARRAISRQVIRSSWHSQLLVRSNLIQILRSVSHWSTLFPLSSRCFSARLMTDIRYRRVSEIMLKYKSRAPLIRHTHIPRLTQVLPPLRSDFGFVLSDAYDGTFYISYEHAQAQPLMSLLEFRTNDTCWKLTGPLC